MENKTFNIRVYGLLINDRNELLLSHEKRHGIAFTKLPGGGLQWGEGMIDCLKREFLEELGIAIEVGNLFYLTDYFQPSAFSASDQIISVYYYVHADLPYELPVQADTENHNFEIFHWTPISDLTEDSVTFPIDRIVIKKIIDLH